MGNSFRKMFDTLFGNREMRVVMLGLDAAGKTTILYKLHIGEVLSTVPTIGFNVEKVQYKNVLFTVWDVGGQEKLRPLWRHYFNNTDGLIYVVDSQDRERVSRAASEFKAIVEDPLMRHSAVLVFANKQDLVIIDRVEVSKSPERKHVTHVGLDTGPRVCKCGLQKGALSTAEVCEALGLGQLKNRSWHVQGAVSIRGEGLYEGLDWLANTLKNMQRSGKVTNVTAAGR